MSIIVRRGVIRSGQVIVDEPINLPDGSEVTITGIPCGNSAGDEYHDQLGPEEIAATLAAMDKIEPFEMTPEEEAALAAERHAGKEREKAQFVKEAERQQRMWE